MNAPTLKGTLLILGDDSCGSPSVFAINISAVKEDNMLFIKAASNASIVCFIQWVDI